VTLTQIHYFLELCKTMNFTKAAQNLYISQPTLSRQIQLLEAELKVTLLERTNREMILTRAGEVFRKEFSQIEDEIDVAIMRVKKASESQKEIRIGFSESLIPMHILNLLEQLKAHLPSYSFQICQAYYYELRHQFERGMLDLVVSIEAIDSDDWKVQWHQGRSLPAYFTYSGAMFPEGYEPTTEDFKDKKLICSSRAGAENIARKQRRILASAGITVAEEDIVFVEDIISALMFTHSKSGYAVFCNPIEYGLKTKQLPESAERFNMVACWNRQTMPHLTEFFEEILPASDPG